MSIISSQETYLTTVVAGITHVSKKLPVHIDIEVAAAGNNCNQVGLVKASFEGRTGSVAHCFEIIIVHVHIERVAPGLVNSKGIIVRAAAVCAEVHSPVISPDDRHLYLESEVAKVAGLSIRSASKKVVRL